MLHRNEELKNISLFGTAICIMLIGCMEEASFAGITIIGSALVICTGTYYICIRTRKKYLKSRTMDRMMIKAPGRKKTA